MPRMPSCRKTPIWRRFGSAAHTINYDFSQAPTAGPVAILGLGDVRPKRPVILTP